MREFINRLRRSFLFRFIRKCLNKVENRLNYFTLDRSGRRFDETFRDFLGFMSWMVPAAKKLLLNGNGQPRRLLAVYDLTSQPFSIGDILTIQEATLVIREQEQLDQVDFAILYDPSCSVCVDPAFASITPENIHSHLASILPAAQVNPHHGSLFIFNSSEQLHRFVAMHGSEYHVWPTAWKFGTRKYNYYYVLNELLHDYYLTHGAIPHLSCRPSALRWAKEFFERHVHAQVAVTVQLRKNKNICPSRNTDIDDWLRFFAYCEDHYPIQFVVVCALSEVDDRLRECRNVTVAKDHGTNIEEDLALIQSAAIHMGAVSGPGQLAIFNAKPYLLISPSIHLNGHDDVICHDDYCQFTFATPFQRFIEPTATLDVLIAEFDRMWATVDLAEWNMDDARQPAQGSEVYSWLR
jgi:hypothetical protein